MISKEKLDTMKRLKEEFDELREEPITELGCTVGLKNPNDIFHWKISLTGAKDTPYAGGIFILDVDFPDNYPQAAPMIKFVTKIYHLNITEDGKICTPFFDKWNPNTNMKQVIGSLFMLFYTQDTKNTIAGDKALLYDGDREKFVNNVKDYIKKYASIKNVQQ